MADIVAAYRRGITAPAVMPEELAFGYYGRLSRWNGGLGREALTCRAFEYFGAEAGQSKPVSEVIWLARMLGQSTQKFACDHTMVPYTQAFDAARASGEHGGPARLHCLINVAFRLPRSFVQYCPKCAAEDLDYHGFSYWRRHHQLPGVLWCDKHRTPLLGVEKKWIFGTSPGEFAASEAEQVDFDWVKGLIDDPILDRFRLLQEFFLAAKHPIREVAVSRLLRDRAVDLGFHGGRGDVRKPLLSAHICKTLNRRWLAELVKGSQDAGGHWFPSIDGALLGHHETVGVPAMLLVAAVLWDTPEEAFNAIANSEATDQPQLFRSRETPLWNLYDLESAYIACDGRHFAVAESIGVPKPSAAAALKRIGLPALGEQPDKALLAAAHAFVNESEGLAQAALDHGVAVADLEQLLRRAAGPFGAALKKMQEHRQGGETQLQRPEGQHSGMKSRNTKCRPQIDQNDDQNAGSRGIRSS